MYEQIRYEASDAVARVTLDRAKYRNAQSRVLLEEMDAAFTQAMDDPSVRVVVLFGEGEHFSSGHDLGTPDEMADRQERPIGTSAYPVFDRPWKLYVDFSLRWRDLPKPTIAAVQGYCIFGGFIVASSMDLVVASDDAKFLGGPVQFLSLPWEVGFRKAKQLMLEGRIFSATEAQELGFVNHVVPRGSLEERTLAVAARVAELDPFVARMIKRSVNMAQDAAGYRVAIESAFSNFELMAFAGRIKDDDPDAPRKRLSLVDRALRWSRQG